MAGGIVAILRGRPVHPVGPDGRMAVSDHLRELRSRLIFSALVFGALFVVALFHYHELFDVIARPYNDAREQLHAQQTMPTTNGVTGGFLLYMKICGWAAVFASSPFWLYQIWAFVSPGLHRHERRRTQALVAITVPLFLGGVALGYWTLRLALRGLIGFNVAGLTNLVDFNGYLTFFIRTLLVFGLALELPVFAVLLNFSGVLSAQAFRSAWRWIVVGTFTGAAIVAPSPDPFTMIILAGVMCVLFVIAGAIAHVNDKRRARAAPNFGLDPDEASELDLSSEVPGA
ncbi:Sec-independent protein translocase protein TatC [Nocardioides baekrokdamisoli]|uniref:Sec-independent protein translocase protein TatC n=1 Tax=Nocardioides baekrokdamisoli TaxID=1804624 RepID=A0A3G9IXF4_9ACTN|nr:twin-arginine translocase subunit TatC [Nocardioides baekrokdamisoli]BBH15958.1 Sec-independent protein translocase protein TatC [Nocardioides baekrokdamisoli]